MTTIARFVGLDVHKDTISIAVAEDDRCAAVHLADIPYNTHQLLKKLDNLGARASISCCYEAGPTGYGLQRFLETAGITCCVIAPSLIPVKHGDRVKNDKRDAKKLAHYHRSGDLTPVWVPDKHTESLRDLVRARLAAKADERAARHRLSKFLLRNELRYPGKTSWTKTHLAWIQDLKFDYEAQSRVRLESLHAVEQIGERIKRLDADIEELGRASSLWPLIHALQALKGVRVLTATAIAVEIGDLNRFECARYLMSYLGLAAGEHSSGGSIRRQGITKCGNNRIRRLLIESAWAYRHPPRKDAHLAKRSEGLSPRVIAIGWKAQDRLSRRFRKMVNTGKARQLVVTAIARELAGFVWAIGQEVKLQPN